jgi:ribonuclease HI
MTTGLTPIDIKIEETAHFFQITKVNKKEEEKIDHDTRTKHWLHPALSLTILENSNEDDSTIQIFPDGSKTETGVDAGAAIFITGKHTASLKYRLHKRCTNNQSEQVAILKSLEYIKNIHTAGKKVAVYTDSQTTLDSITNTSIHTPLTDKIRLQTLKLEQSAWNVRLCWVKTQEGIQGNELADTLAKKAATNVDIPICYNKIAKSVVKREIERKVAKRLE